ncbi:hypothetical protein AG1IA_06942 [Rhizoctonia solani AG-1 IA]|uniref:Uncharacterized protein n=1 Tax=Thanatephorus cucumeris (strain AG1-IA) TaxID=983506 RepID=L8WLH4_THACA|nr:hypothetical protein AG1IA_06942 [Rhizoctonia solani AG-1 IA]
MWVLAVDKLLIEVPIRCGPILCKSANCLAYESRIASRATRLSEHSAVNIGEGLGAAGSIPVIAPRSLAREANGSGEGL